MSFNNLGSISSIDDVDAQLQANEEEALKGLKKTSGRITDYTLENFFFSFWLNFSVGILMVLIFLCYRNLRGDQETLEMKLAHKMEGSKKSSRNKKTEQAVVVNDLDTGNDPLQIHRQSESAPQPLPPNVNGDNGQAASALSKISNMDSEVGDEKEVDVHSHLSDREKNLMSLIGQDIKQMNFIGLLQIIDEK